MSGSTAVFLLAVLAGEPEAEGIDAATSRIEDDGITEEDERDLPASAGDAAEVKPDAETQAIDAEPSATNSAPDDDEASDPHANEYFAIDEHCYGAPLTRNFRVVRGKYSEPVDGRTFYRTVGREDLATGYQRRRAARTGLIVSGVLVAVASIAAGVSVLRLSGPSNQFRSLSDEGGGPDRRKQIGFGVLFGGMIGGIGLVVAGVAVPPHPIPAHEARALVDEHNRELRRRLGLVPL